MNTIHDDDATTWRDLADQLTPQQIAEMEYCEREQIPPGLSEPRHFLNSARAMIRHNLVQAMCADVPPPSEATGTLCDWEERDGDRFGRMFTVSRADVADTGVEICGVQYDDGRIERAILLTDAPEDITAAEARALAAALLAAADDLDRLTGRTG